MTPGVSRKPLIKAHRLLAVALALMTALAGAQGVAVPDLKQLADPQWIAQGRETFVQTCGNCHGAEGDAGKARPFRERVDWDPQAIHDVIANGRRRGANVMPAWKDSLSEDEIWRITAYIRSLGGKPKPE
jgi:mono/diheme cytochrome c family protein